VIAQALIDRNMEPVFIGSETLVSLAAASEEARFDLLSKMPGDEAQVMMVEARPQFFAPLDGRYRWTVSLRLWIKATGPKADAAAALVRDSSLPIFLRYDHERAREALDAAASDTGRFVGKALDAYLASRLTTAAGTGAVEATTTP